MDRPLVLKHLADGSFLHGKPTARLRSVAARVVKFLPALKISMINLHDLSVARGGSKGGGAKAAAALGWWGNSSL